MKALYLFLVIMFSFIAFTTVEGQSCGNYGKNGEDHCPCDTCPTSSGDPFDPYTGNEYRATLDLEVMGSVGEIPLVWMRYANSRFGNYTYNYGVAHNWNSSFNYNMFDWGTNSQGHAQILIHYPEGGHNIFTQSTANPNMWLPISAVTKRLIQVGSNFFLQMGNGHRYRFERLTDASGGIYYQLQDIRDSQQNLYKLNYNSDKRLTRVTEPAGRFLEISYGTMDNGTVHPLYVIKQVTTSDGRSVHYNYGIIDDAVNGFGWVSLESVNYGDGTKAVYTYSQSEPGSRPNLEHAVDPRYSGTDANMKFTYDTDNVWGFVKEEINGITGKVMVTLNSESDNRTACYANGRIQHFKMPTQLMGMIKEYTDGLGGKTTFTYDLEGTIPGDIGFMKSETDALGRITTYNRRTIYGNSLEITYPDASKEIWTRDDLDLVLSQTDELGQVTTFTRDNRHRITRIKYPDASTERFTYNNFSQVLTHTLTNGGVEFNTYDRRGLKTHFSDALGNRITFTYDAADRLASITDARRNTTRYEYNERGLLTKLINADRSGQVYGYDDFGNRVSITNELSNTWITVYDEFKRPVIITDPLNRATKYDYDLPGGVCGCAHDNDKPTRITLPSGKVTEIEYDVEWQQIRETVGVGSSDAATTFFEYDIVGNLTIVIDPEGKNWLTEYDLRNRTKSKSDPLGNQTNFSYDAIGNILTVNRPDNGLTKNDYDNRNRLIKITDPKQQVTKMTYDEAGNKIKIVDPNNHNYNFKYDLLNRLTKMIYPGGQFESFSYDQVGNVNAFKTKAGKVSTYRYDNRNRRITTVWSDATPDIMQNYDAGNRLLTMISSVSSLSYTYDDANELTSETQHIAGSVGAKTVRYKYDMDGHSQSIGYPDETEVDNSYTSRNQLSSILANGQTLVTYMYDLNGNRINKSLSNGTSTEYMYDNSDRMLSLDNQKNKVSFARFDYGYDNVDRRASVKRNNVKGDAYTYDAIDQLINVKYEVTNPNGSPYNPLRTVNYDLDAAGNRISLTDNGISTNYTTNNLNQYTKVGGDLLNYDANGDLKTFNDWTYSYDAQDRLVKAVKGRTTVNFRYDPRNRCVKRTVNTKATFFYYDGWNLIEEKNSRDVLQANYINGAEVDEMLRKTTSSQTVYYHYDAIGSVIRLTNNSGNVVEQYFYDVFGAPSIKDRNGNDIENTAFGNRFLFTGREYILEISLYDYRNRFYSHDLGRFLQTDPIRFVAGELNLYRYVYNNPVNKTDPSGLQGGGGGGTPSSGYKCPVSKWDRKICRCLPYGKNTLIAGACTTCDQQCKVWCVNQLVANPSFDAASCSTDCGARAITCVASKCKLKF